ncbi:MAG TPA: hypothetical protein VF034_04005 [Gemmatimonadaceae bacterium]|jgi:hypothetical protein
MKRRVFLLGVSVAAAALACGEVPTLDQGIAYISPIILPAPAVAVGDQLRDSLGNVAPLRIEAFGRNDEQLPDPQATFLPTVVPSPISIDADGTVTASDTVSTVKTVQLVGRVGSKLQTTAVSLLIVPQPDSLGRASDSLNTATFPVSDTMRVTVTGVNRTKARVAVPGIIVHYRIADVYGPGKDAATAVLTLEGGALSRPDPRMAVDTTDASGLASRTLVVAGENVDSVVVYVRARSLRGEPLRGDSLRFILRPKP